MKEILLMFTLASSAANAEEFPGRPPTRKIVVAANPHLWLEGNSTFHRYKAAASEFSADVQVDPSASEQSLDALVRAGAIKTLTLKVPVRNLKSGESGLDDNLYKSLKADAQPVIVFRMLSYKTVKPNGNGVDIVIHGRLEVAGLSHDIDINADRGTYGDCTAHHRKRGRPDE